MTVVGAGMSYRPSTGALALEPARGAAATLAHVLALPDFANDTIVIVGDLDGYRGRRATYREIFTTLGRARRPVIWMPGTVDNALAREVRRTYETASSWPSSSRSTRSLLLTSGVPIRGLSDPANEILSELIQTFRPRLAARVARPAVYLVRDHGRPQWLEV